MIADEGDDLDEDEPSSVSIHTDRASDSSYEHQHFQLRSRRKKRKRVTKKSKREFKNSSGSPYTSESSVNKDNDSSTSSYLPKTFEVKLEMEDQFEPNGAKTITCYICNLELTKIYNLRIHMAAHTTDKSFETINFQNSEIINILNPHKRNIDNNIIKKFIMQEIKEKRYSKFYKIVNAYGREMHISDSETCSDNDCSEKIIQNTYKCEICKETFDRRYKILIHQKCHNSEELYIQCDYCTKKFASMFLLIHHMKTICENDEKPYSCKERFMKFLLQANLEYYASVRQAREDKKNRKLTEPPRRFGCTECGKSFSRQEHLNRHKAVHLPDEKKFECSICNRKFNRKDNMRSHMKVHLDDPPVYSESKTILCAYCGKSFCSKSNYVVHMRRHTGEKPYKCDLCDKAFPKSTDLHSHRVTHTKEKNFVCKVCSKAYARSAVLSKHMRVHQMPFSCTICKKTFTKPSSLKVHLRTHSDQKVYICVMCGECFQQQQQLHNHRQITGHCDPKVETKPETIRSPIRDCNQTATGSQTDIFNYQHTQIAGIPAPTPTPLILTHNEVSIDPLEIKEEERLQSKSKTFWGFGQNHTHPQSIVANGGIATKIDTGNEDNSIYKAPDILQTYIANTSSSIETNNVWPKCNYANEDMIYEETQTTPF